MHKILVFTDLHLKAQGTIIGLDPVARFTAARDAALAAHGDAVLTVLLGDLTHSGKPEEYELLADLLTPFPMPVLPMLGNHDNRAAFLDRFPDAAGPDGFVQRIVDLDGVRLILLDTLDEPRSQGVEHAGVLCARRLAFLDTALAGAGARQVLVFAHHPPFAVGFPGMDAIRLRDGGALTTRLAPLRAHLFCGHVHRTISGSVGGVPFTIFKSPCHQMPLDFTDETSALSTDEPGAFGVVLAGADGVIAHSEDVGLNARIVGGYDALPDP